MAMNLVIELGLVLFQIGSGEVLNLISRPGLEGLSDARNQVLRNCQKLSYLCGPNFYEIVMLCLGWH